MRTECLLSTCNMIFKKKMQKSLFFLKTISLVLLICLVSEQFLMAAETQTIALPEKMGVVTRDVQNGEDRLVVHIQDAHTKLDSQKSIASLLDYLASNFDLGLVSMEGASGDLDASLISAFPDETVRQKTAEFLLKEGKIGAAEFYSMIGARDVRLYGAEDVNLYEKNKKALETLLENKLYLRDQFKRISEGVKKLESKAFSKRFIEFAAYGVGGPGEKSDLIKTASRFRETARETGTNIHSYPAFAQLTRLISLEKKINFPAASKEREVFFGLLASRLPREHLQSLIKASLEYKKGLRSTGSFHSYLMKHMTRDDRKRFSNLFKYSWYLKAYEQINLLLLLTELDALESRLQDRLATGVEERNALSFVRRLRLLRGLLNTTLSSGDYQEYRGVARAGLSALQAESERLGDLYAISELKAIDWPSVYKTVPAAEAFYELALERNQSFVQNTLEKMKKENVRVAALVTGGFHSEGVTRLMDNEHVSHVVIMPKFDARSKDRPYITVLTKRPKEYEEAFKDSDSFLTAQALLDPRLSPLGRLEALAIVIALGKSRLLKSRAEQAEYLRSLVRQWRKSAPVDSEHVVTPRTVAQILREMRRGQNVLSLRDRGYEIKIPASKGIYHRFKVTLSDGEPVVSAYQGLTDEPLPAPRPVKVLERPKKIAIRETPVKKTPPLITPVTAVSPAPKTLPASEQALAGARLVNSKSKMATLWGEIQLAFHETALVLATMDPVFLSLMAILFWPMRNLDSMFQLACGPSFAIMARDTSRPRSELMSDELRDVQNILNREAKTRGSQSGGWALLAQDKKTGDVVIVFDKVVNGKRTDIVEVLDAQTQEVIVDSVKDGIISVENWEMVLNHLRFATGGATNWDNAQPHWHEDPRRMPVYSVAIENIQGRNQAVLDVKRRTVANMVNHNGDCDEVVLEVRYGTEIKNVTLHAKKKARLFFTRVMPRSSSLGDSDSKTIAEWTDFTLTQGQVAKSVRYAFYTRVMDFRDVFGGYDPNIEDVSDTPNGAVSEGEIEGWAKIADAAVAETYAEMGKDFFNRSALTLADVSDAAKARLREKLAQRFQKEWGAKKAADFADQFIVAFFYHDLARIMRKAQASLKGTFALNIFSTLEARIGIYALTQTFTVGHNRTRGSVYGSAEPEGVTVALAQAEPGKEIVQAFLKDGQFGTVELDTLASERPLQLYEPAETNDASEPLVPVLEKGMEWFPINDNPKIDLPTRPENVDDEIARDLKDIPYVLSRIVDSFKPGGENAAAMSHLKAVLKQKALDWVGKESELMRMDYEQSRVHHQYRSQVFDIVLYGVDFDHVLVREFVKRMKEAAPYLNIVSMNSGNALKMLKKKEKGYDSPQVDSNTVFIGITNSAQTQSTLAVTRKAIKTQKPGYVIGVTQKRFNALSQILGQKYGLEEPVLPTTFLNLSNFSSDGTNGRRRTEASTVVTAATQAVLTEMLLGMTEGLIDFNQDRTIKAFGMNGGLNRKDLRIFREFQHVSYAVEIPRRVGFDASGLSVQTEDTDRINEEAEHRAQNLTESQTAFALHSLAYVALVATIFGMPVFHVLISGFVGHLVASVLDAALFLSGTWLWTLAIRWRQGRPLFDRLNPRIEVHIERDYIARILERYNATIFSNAPGWLSPIVYSADFIKEALHRFHMRSHRGTVTLHRIPDERMGLEEADDAKSAAMVHAQIGGIHFNAGHPQAHVTVREGSVFSKSKGTLDPREPELVLSDAMSGLRARYDGRMSRTTLHWINRRLIDLSDGLVTEFVVGHRRAVIVSESTAELVKAVLGDWLGERIVKALHIEKIWVPGSTANGALIQSTEHPVGADFPGVTTMKTREDAGEEDVPSVEIFVTKDSMTVDLINIASPDLPGLTAAEDASGKFYISDDATVIARVVEEDGDEVLRISFAGSSEDVIVTLADISKDFQAKLKEPLFAVAGARLAGTRTLSYESLEERLLFYAAVDTVDAVWTSAADAAFAEEFPSRPVMMPEKLGDRDSALAPQASPSRAAAVDAFFSEESGEQRVFQSTLRASDFEVVYDADSKSLTIRIDKEAIMDWVEQLKEFLGEERYEDLKDKIFLRFSAVSLDADGAPIVLAEISAAELEKLALEETQSEVEIVLNVANILPAGEYRIQVETVSKTPEFSPDPHVLVIGNIKVPDSEKSEESNESDLAAQPFASTQEEVASAAPEAGGDAGGGGGYTSTSAGSSEIILPPVEVVKSSSGGSVVFEAPLEAILEELPLHMPIVPMTTQSVAVPLSQKDEEKSWMAFLIGALQFLIVTAPVAMVSSVAYVAQKRPAIQVPLYLKSMAAGFALPFLGYALVSQDVMLSTATVTVSAFLIYSMKPQSSVDGARLVPQLIKSVVFSAGLTLVLLATALFYHFKQVFSDKPYADLSLNPTISRETQDVGGNISADPFGPTWAMWERGSAAATDKEEAMIKGSELRGDPQIDKVIRALQTRQKHEWEIFESGLAVRFHDLTGTYRGDPRFIKPKLGLVVTKSEVENYQRAEKFEDDSRKTKKETMNQEIMVELFGLINDPKVERKYQIKLIHFLAHHYRHDARLVTPLITALERLDQDYPRAQRQNHPVLELYLERREAIFVALRLLGEPARQPLIDYHKTHYAALGYTQPSLDYFLLQSYGYQASVLYEPVSPKDIAWNINRKRYLYEHPDNTLKRTEIDEIRSMHNQSSGANAETLRAAVRTGYSAQIDRLVVSSDEQTRANVARALGETGNPHYMPLLLDLMEDANPRVRREAAQAAANFRVINSANARDPKLVRLVRVLANQTSDADVFPRAQAVSALTTLGNDQKALYLLDLILNEGHSSGTRAESLTAIWPDTEERVAVEELRHALLSSKESAAIRLSALEGVLTLNSPGAFDIVVQYLKRLDHDAELSQMILPYSDRGPETEAAEEALRILAGAHTGDVFIKQTLLRELNDAYVHGESGRYLYTLLPILKTVDEPAYSKYVAENDPAIHIMAVHEFAHSWVIRVLGASIFGVLLLSRLAYQFKGETKKPSKSGQSDSGKSRKSADAKKSVEPRAATPAPSEPQRVTATLRPRAPRDDKKGARLSQSASAAKTANRSAHTTETPLTVDLSRPLTDGFISTVVERLTNGYLVRIDISRLSPEEDQTLYERIAQKFVTFSEAVKQDLLFNGVANVGATANALNELLKNAFVHGNQLNPHAKIYMSMLRSENRSYVNRIEVFDEGLPKENDAFRLNAVYTPELTGDRLGVREIESIWDGYQRHGVILLGKTMNRSIVYRFGASPVLLPPNSHRFATEVVSMKYPTELPIDGARLSLSPLKIGVITDDGEFSKESAGQLLAQRLGESAHRFEPVFIERGADVTGAIQTLQDQGVKVVLDASSIADAGVKFQLLKLLQAQDTERLETVWPLFKTLFLPDAPALSTEESIEVLRRLERQFPEAAPREIAVVAGSAFLQAEADTDEEKLAEFADARISELLLYGVSTVRQNKWLTSAVASIRRKILSPESMSRFSQALTRQFKTRLALSDPSFTVDLSGMPSASVTERKVVVTDLDVFAKDPEGFALRMEHLDRKAHRLFDHVLLVRRALTKDELLAQYPAAAAFGNNILIQPAAETLEEVLRLTRDLSAVSADALLLMPKAGVLSQGDTETSEFKKILVYSLDEKAETTIGMLETGALSLLKAELRFAEIIYLPPAAPLDYLYLLRMIAQARRQLEQSA